jgi:hypothetical protein
MAIKLSGSISRKIPIDSVPYSSQSFSAGMEVEINSADAGTIQAQLAQLYANLSQGIDAQIATTTQQPTLIAAASQRNGNATVAHQAPPVQHTFNGNGNGNGGIPAPSPAAAHASSTQNGYAGRNRVAGANGNGRRVTATEAQVKCIHAVCRARGLDLVSVLADFNVADPKDLHIKDASRLIDQIKNGTAA